MSVGGGGIYTDLALKEAYGALAHESVNLKHVLLFADGGDAEQIAGCRALVGAAEKSGITTSVISLGRGSDSPELEALSKIGGGRFYLIDDATKLPAVFTQETILATKSAIHEDPFRVSLGAPSAGTRGIDFGAAPALGGYVVTVPKPRATVSLTGPEGDPILATWSVGIGRAAAFTSDYKDRWGQNWLAWQGAQKMFGQVARDLARKEEDPRVRLASDAVGGELHVRADVVGDDGRAQTFRRLTVHVAGPDGFGRDVPLEAVGAGRYAANVPLSRPGTYVATAKDEVTGDGVGTTGAVLSAGEELRPTGSDRVLLARVAAMTGGKQRDTLAGLFDDRAARRFAYTPLAPLLAMIAGIALVVGVGARRLRRPRFRHAAWSPAPREGKHERRSQRPRGPRRRRAPPTSARALEDERLRSAKQRAQARAPRARRPTRSWKRRAEGHQRRRRRKRRADPAAGFGPGRRPRPSANSPRPSDSPSAGASADRANVVCSSTKKSPQLRRPSGAAMLKKEAVARSSSSFELRSMLATSAPGLFWFADRHQTPRWRLSAIKPGGAARRTRPGDSRSTRTSAFRQQTRSPERTTSS